MPFVEDENGDYIIDENGKKIEFNVDHIETDKWYIHKEAIHLNNDGHLDTENRHIVIKEGKNDNHAVCKKQLDQLDTNTNKKLSALQASITSSINSLKSQINELRILIGYNKMNNHMPSNFNRNR